MFCDGYWSIKSGYGRDANDADAMKDGAVIFRGAANGNGREIAFSFPKAGADIRSSEDESSGL